MRDAYGREQDPAKRKTFAEQIQLEAVKLVPTVLLGQFYQPSAYRANVLGWLEVPIPVVWNVEKR